jgi:hypothetical protein
MLVAEAVVVTQDTVLNLQQVVREAAEPEQT